MSKKKKLKEKITRLEEANRTLESNLREIVLNYDSVYAQVLMLELRVLFEFEDAVERAILSGSAQQKTKGIFSHD